MNLMSSLRIPAVAGVRSVLSATSKGKLTPTCLMQVRHGGGEHKMVIKPSTYNRDRFKDDFYYFMTIGLVPLGLFVTYQNVKYGPAELREIPDDYEPEHWEYYRDPVRRFMAKHRFTTSHAKAYERTAHFAYNADQERRATLLMRRVKKAMTAAPTQREWYLVPDTIEDRRRYNEKVNEKFERGLSTNKWT